MLLKDAGPGDGVGIGVVVGVGEGLVAAAVVEEDAVGLGILLDELVTAAVVEEDAVGLGVVVDDHEAEDEVLGAASVVDVDTVVV